MGANVTFRQRDLRIALAEAREAGLTVRGYDIDRNGKISVFTDNEAKQKPSSLRETIDAEKARVP